MLRASLSAVWDHRAALGLGWVSLVVSVALVGCTVLLTETFRAGTHDAVRTAYAGSDLVVTPGAPAEPTGSVEDWTLDGDLVAAVGGLPGVAEAAGFTWVEAELLDRGSRPVADTRLLRRPVAGSWVDADGLNPFALAAGHAPRRDDEVVVDRADARRAGYEVGDTVVVQTPAGARDYRLAGVVTFAGADSVGGVGVVLFTPDEARELARSPGRVDQVHVTLDDGVDADRVAAAIASLGEEAQATLVVRPGEAFVAEAEATLTGSEPLVDAALRGRIASAVLAGGLVAAGSVTFTVVRRRREYALLRLLGASRARVGAAALVEAVVLGTTAALAGALLAVAVAHVVLDRLDAAGVVPGAGRVGPSATFVVLSLGLGLLLAGAGTVTAQAVVFRLSPREALLGSASAPAPAGPPRWRWRPVVAAACVVAGLVVVDRRPGIDRGAATALLVLALVATLALLPPLVRNVARGLRRVARGRGVGTAGAVGAVGVAGRVAVGNLVDHPRRAATAVGPVVVGVALVAFSVGQSASYQASRGRHVVDLFATVRADVLVEAGNALPDGVADRIDDLRTTAAAAGLRRGAVEVGGREWSLVGTGRRRPCGSST
ncbi:MAG TPA: FtsX-like permease family protein [Acidimicrobiales bacterium]